MIAEEIRHGIRTWIVALATWYTSADNHFVGDLLAPLDAGKISAASCPTLAAGMAI
jgi:hypothetical protein